VQANNLTAFEDLDGLFISAASAQTSFSEISPSELLRRAKIQRQNHHKV
jgi:hypothetical protein